MKNAVIYARFSSHAQNEQSIEGQLAECYAFAERNDLRIVREYIDRALTGTSDKRPEFLQIIEDSKRKGFQHVIVYQLDRFARNRYDSEIKRLENLIEENQKAINNLMQALMHGKIANTILAQIEKLENENAELNATIESEKALQINYTYDDIRKWLEHFRTLDYTKTKNRKALIDTFIYRVLLYDDKMKVLFHLKGGQKNELLLNLIFPDYPDGNGGEDENSAKEKETANAISLSEGCAYTPVMVDESGLAPESYRFCLSFLHTYSAFKLKQISPTDGKNLPHTAKFFQLRAVKRN